MNIELSIPAIAAEPDASVELRGVFLEDWVDSLPLANPAALVDAVLERLDRFNRSPVKPGLRVSLLEIFLRPYRFVLERQERHGPVHSATALHRQLQDADSARRVAMALATGYKIALLQAPERRSMFGGGRDQRIALQRAMLFTGLALLHSYDEYLPVPSGLWSDLHRLFAAGEADGLTDDRPPASGLRKDFDDSAGIVYRRVLLTALVDPYRLSHGDVWRVFAALGDCAGLAGLVAPGSIRRAAGLFVVDPEEDLRPVPFASAGSPPGPGCRLFDTAAVLDALQGMLRRQRESGRRPGTPSPVASSALLGSMIRALGLPPQRHTPREPSEGRVRLTGGLHAVHHFLGGGAVDPAPRTDDGHIELTDTAGLASPGRVGYLSESWELLDQGPGGIGVLKRKRPDQAIGVGELIGIQFPMRGESGTRWSVGVVRWLSIQDVDEYQAGVQILSRHASPVCIEVPGATEETARMIAGLALPATGEKRSATLLAPAGVFAAATSLHLQMDGELIVVVPEKLIESTAAFERFSYRRAS